MNTETILILYSVLFVGTQDGKLVRIRINDENFSSSQVDSISIANQSVATIEVDTLRGYLYATTAGTAKADPAVVFQVSLASFTLENLLILNSLDFAVSSSAIVDSDAGNALKYLNLAIRSKPKLINFRRDLVFGHAANSKSYYSNRPDKICP